MDTLGKYRSIVKQILSQQAEYVPSHGQIESRPIIDEHSDNYLLVDVGWDRTGRIYSVLLHLCIKDDQIWIERDGTETGIAYELIEAGVPKEDIVLGFYRPERRAIVDFAAA